MKAERSAGTRLMDAGDDGAALAPLAEALNLDRRSPARIAQHRRRFAWVLTLAPHLDRMWFANGPLRWAAFSPDKTRVAAGGEDGQAFVWEVATGKLLPLAMAHTGAVTDAAFSPDGRRLVTCGDDDLARVWDLKACRLLWTLGPLNPPGESDLTRTDGRSGTSRAAWSRDGRRIATAWGSTVTVWDVGAAGGASRSAPAVLRHDENRGKSCTGVAFAPDGKILAVIARNYIGLQISMPGGHVFSRIGSRALGDCYVGRHLAYSRDGRHLLVAGTFGGSSQHAGACILSALPPDTHSDREAPAMLPHRAQGLYAVFSPDESRIATASDDGTARVWEATTGRPLTSPMTHGCPVVHVEFSPDGRRVVTASLDGTARVWEAASGVPVCTLHHAGPLVTAQFGADGSHVLTAGRDGTVRLWTLPPAGPQPALRVKNTWDGISLLSGTRLGIVAAQLRIYDLTTESLLSSHPVKPSWFPELDVIRGRFVLAGDPLSGPGNQRGFQVWDALGGPPLSPVLHAAQAFLSPDADTLLLRDTNNTIRLVDPATGHPLLRPLRSAVVPRYNDLSPPFTPDGRGVLIRDSPWSVRLMDRRTGRTMTPSMRHPDPVGQWAFSPDSRYLFTRTTTGSIQAWNLASGTPASPAVPHSLRFENASSVVRGLDFSPDGRYAASAGEACAWFWRLDGSAVLRPQPFEAPATDRFVFSPDGATFAAMGQKAWLWDARALAPIRLSVDYGIPLQDTVFSPDSRRVLAVLADGTASVWDARTGHPVTAPLSQNGIIRAAFSPDGTMWATGGADGRVRVWDTDTGEALTPPLLMPPPSGDYSNYIHLAFTAGHLLVNPMVLLMARRTSTSGPCRPPRRAWIISWPVPGCCPANALIPTSVPCRSSRPPCVRTGRSSAAAAEAALCRSDFSSHDFPQKRLEHRSGPRRLPVRRSLLFPPSRFFFLPSRSSHRSSRIQRNRHAAVTLGTLYCQLCRQK